MAKIIVAGTLYIDYIFPFKFLPRVGETVVTTTMERVVGGKGANQAVMCRNCGVGPETEVYAPPLGPLD